MARKKTISNHTNQSINTTQSLTDLTAFLNEKLSTSNIFDKSYIAQIENAIVNKENQEEVIATLLKNTLIFSKKAIEREETLLKEIEIRTEDFKKRSDELESKLTKQESKLKKQENKIHDLEGQLAVLRRSKFGQSSEQSKYLETDPLQLSLFGSSIMSSLIQEKPDEEVEVKTVREHTRRVKVKKKDNFEDIPCTEQRDSYPPEYYNNPNFKELYSELAPQISYEVVFQPAKMYRIKHVRHKYILKTVGQMKDLDKPVTIIGPLAKKPIYKSPASASLLAELLINKYQYHIPFNRQIKMFNELGAYFSDSTINGWYAATCSLLRPLYELLQRQVIVGDYLQVDETVLPVINKENRKAKKDYLWAVRNPLTKMTFFYYDSGSRSGRTARKIIDDFKGAIQTDGFSSYKQFEKDPKKLMLPCWAHVRRYWVNARSVNEKIANKAITYINALYTIEKEMNEQNFTAEQKREKRQSHSLPIIDQFEEWLDELSYKSGVIGLLNKALKYTYPMIDYLKRYTLDGRYFIDNNNVENIIRRIAIGRKNFLFCGNEKSAENTALIYSLFATCELLGVNIRTWLEDILPELDGAESYEQFLPNEWKKAQDAKADEQIAE